MVRCNAIKEEEAIQSERMENSDFLSHLPEEILLQILLKLPAKALIQLIFVSKLFKNLIYRSDFIRNYTVESTCSDQFFLSVKVNKFCTISNSSYPWKLIAVRSMPFKLSTRSTMVGSARGLVCFVDFDNFHAIPTLWNPVIARFKALLPFKVKHLVSNFKHVFFGFGFDHVNIDYKLVMILYSWYTDEEFHAQAFVYETKTGSWRNLDQTVPCLLSCDQFAKSLFVNGVVYWLAFKTPRMRHNYVDCLMGFDLVNEVFKVIELPQHRACGRRYELSMSPDEKYLALSISTGWVQMLWTVWFLIDDDSWNIQFFYDCSRQKQFCQDEEEVKIVNDGETLAKLTSSGGRSVLSCVRLEERKEFSSLILTGSDYITRYTPSLAFLVEQ